MTRPELHSRLFSAAGTIGAVAAVLWFGLEGRRPAPAPTWSQIEVGGKVTDALSGRPVPYAQVLIEQERAQLPATTYSNSEGLYAATLKAATDHFAARITARAVNYRDSVGEFKLTRTVDLEMMPLHIATARKTVESPPIPSGSGAGWGGWNSLCLTPPPGSHLGSEVEFHLDGDRSCGAWAECEPVTLTETEVCYRFRIQGHPEASGQAIKPIEANRTTRGVLRVAVEPGEIQRGARRDPGLVYIQFHGAEHRNFAESVASELKAAGFLSPGATEVRMGFPNRVRYFRPEDRQEAAAAAQTLERLARARHLALKLPLDATGNLSVRPGQIEIWIDLDKAARQ